ncbi:MAG TPA: TadE family protein [Lachnospiraceae bacterium]|nr:TadE family protein [Lachnospiraceae bacterium]
MIGLKRKQYNASLTIEAALILPPFIFAICCLLFFLQVLYVQEAIQQGLYKTAKYSSEIAFGYDYVINYKADDESNAIDEPVQSTEVTPKEEQKVGIGSAISVADSDNGAGSSQVSSSDEDAKSDNLVSKVITIGAIRNKFCSVSDNKVLSMPCIANGENGILLSLSNYNDETDEIDIVAYYNIDIPIKMFGLQQIPALQRIKVKAFVGSKMDDGTDDGEKDTNEDGSQDEIVFITETGTVYHRSRDCTHLKLSIKLVTCEELDSLRNASGGKYYPCEICGSNEKQATYYITNQGGCYHSDIHCSGLKRTVYEIALSEVGSRSPCTRCGKGD